MTEKQPQSLPTTILRIVLLFVYLYLFLLSIGLMGDAMKLFGKGTAEALIAGTSNPVVGLFIGILATSLIQSSSTTTSIVVGLVGGNALSVATAIPIVMGANIGTSVTNTLVALAHINRSYEFRRSFAASIVHDYFNVLAVAVIFPLQYFTNYLAYISDWAGHAFQDVGGMNLFNPIKAATKPVVGLISEAVGEIGWIILLISFALLFFALRQIVRSLKVLVVQKAEAWFDRVLFKTVVRAFVVGLILTILAQSSSVTTSLIIPMAGAGFLTLQKIFPYTLGANIGTTVTSMLAALVTGQVDAVTVAFAHLIFNINGIMVWWPLNRVPIYLAEKMAVLALRNKLIPFAYIIILFFIIPLSVILLFS